MRGRQPNSARGFTLLELLVVVAIIAALAAMLYPIMIQAKDSAKMRTCTSNLRQLGAAFRMYLDDHDGYALMPPPASYPLRDVLYVKPLASYVGQQETRARLAVATKSSDPQLRRAWICPGDVTMAGRPCIWGYVGSSYRYPGYDGYVSVTATRLIPRKPEQWAMSRRDMLFADYAPYFHKGIAPAANSRNQSTDYAMAPRSISMLMLDMHVMTVNKYEFKEYSTFVYQTDNPFFKAAGQ